MNETVINNANEPITLKMQIWGNDYRKDITLQTIELFKKENPNINIEIDVVSTKVYSTDLALRVADENMPDIIQVSNLHNYAKRGLLEPFNSYVEQGIVDISDVDLSNFEEGVIDGQIYGLALGLNAYAVAANPLIFEKAGVSIPRGRYTFEDLYNIAKTLKSNLNEADFYPLQEFFKFTIFARSRGERYYNPEGTALGYENDQLFIDYFETYLKWLDEGIIAPTELNKKNKNENALIVTGNSAFYPNYSSIISRYSGYAGHTLEVIATPSGKKGDEGSFIRPSMYFTVSSYSPHKEAAMKFVNFFTNNLDANTILAGDRGIPISNKVSSFLQNQLDDADKQQYYFFNYLNANPSKADPPNPVFKDGVKYVFDKYSSSILSRKITPKDAAPLFRAEANKILSKGKED